MGTFSMPTRLEAVNAFNAAWKIMLILANSAKNHAQMDI
jgi:hypothetical protein